MGNFMRKNWTGLVVVVALIASPVIAYTQSKSTATQIASKAEKRAVAKAALIIYDATIAACERNNATIREVNDRVKVLRTLDGSDAVGHLEVVRCRDEYTRPLP